MKIELIDTGDIRPLLKYAENYLKLFGVISARNDAEILITHLLGIDRYDLYNYGDLDNNTISAYRKLLEKRSRRIPLQYITGSCSFMGIELMARYGVFIPRPETEVLVDEVVNLLKKKKDFLNILDIGTGSANIAIGLTKSLHDCRILAIDNSELSLDLAKMNSKRNNVDDKISFMHMDMREGFNPRLESTFDLIISNPPYIESAQIENLEPEVRHEPITALDGGSDGLLFYREIAKRAKDLLRKNGIIAFEVGFSQCNKVSEILNSCSLDIVAVKKDLRGIDRVVIAEKRG
jgi:release factor glutamine methyltransferase